MQASWYYPLHCQVRHYDWGNRKEDSAIRRILATQGRAIAAGQPCAELWMGAHPTAPSLLQGKISLQRAIATYPSHFLGPRLSELGYTELPFLFKVLDAARPLSIQTHPDAELAKQLHAEQPEHYPDTNAKPEMAISLGGLRALLGFRPLYEITEFFKNIPDLARLAGFVREADPGHESEWLRRHFANIIEADRDELQTAIQTLRHKLDARSNDAADLFHQLTELYGNNDPGVLSPFFFNIARLKDGEGIYITPGEPHAYLHGTILECMGTSDNALRGGLTSKHCDTKNFLEALHYLDNYPVLLRPSTAPIDPYQPAKAPFEMHRIVFPEAKEFRIRNDRPSILLLYKGQASLRRGDESDEFRIQEGSILFFPGDLEKRKWVATLEPHKGSEATLFVASVSDELMQLGRRRITLPPPR